MKIARIKHEDKIQYAVVEEDRFCLIEGDIFGRWRKTEITIPAEGVTLLAPVCPPQIIAIGANYRKHCEECNTPVPEAPLVFLKSCNTITGPSMPIMLPKMAPNEVDYEAELAIVIGKKAKHVSEADADEYILGYTCANDISARDCQLKQDAQWARGKSFDTFAPIGPWIATGLDGDNLDIKQSLNGEIVQDSKTSDMIFSCRYLVSYLSQCMTLYPGSIITTGTPSGVGLSRDPQVFLTDGDKLVVEIEGIGQLANTVELEK